jgi:PBP1b-binding outer membrane lipoprotein LpoB
MNCYRQPWITHRLNNPKEQIMRKRNQPMKYLAPGLIAIALLAGCSAQAPAPEKEVQANLAQAVNCNTAQTDIQNLTGEKARTSQQIEDGVSSIVPVGAVAHMFGGSEKQSLEIATGDYNKKLDAKIAEIKAQCNIQ